MEKMGESSRPVDMDQELERVAINIDIPPCPAILLELSAETNKEQPDFDKLEQLIKRDIGLSASLLKMVNSPFYGLRSKVGNVRQAIGLLGLSMVTTTIYGLVIRDAFPDSNREFMEKFWDSSAKTAMAASFMASRIGGINREDAYTFGLFMDSGIPVLMRKFPDYKQTYEDACSSLDGKFTEMEDEIHGTDHATIGSMLTRSWNLPGVISSAVRSHHEYGMLAESHSALPPECQNFLALGLLAEQVNYNTSSSSEWSQWGSHALKHFNLSEREYQDMLDDVVNLLH